MPDQPGGPLWELARAAGDPGTLMPVSIDMWVLVMVLETLTAPLMFCSLIFQGEEGENPTSFHHHPTGAWENVPFRSNRPIRGEAGGKKQPLGSASQDLMRLLPTVLASLSLD